MAVAMSDAKRKEYQALIMGRAGARSPVTAMADPFAEYSLTDFSNEMDILSAAGAAWGLQFCQATTGFLGRAGGCWIAYSGHTPRSVVHAEQFVGKSTDQKAVNFWAEYLMRGRITGLHYALPFTVLAKFEDGLFSRKWEPGTEAFPPGTIGTRIAKGEGYQDFVNMVITIPVDEFKPTVKKK